VLWAMKNRTTSVQGFAAALVLFCFAAQHARAQAPGLGASIELVDPKVFRVCADPNNMPLSDQQGQGFENKIADLLAQQLGKSVSYVWFPQVVGFARNTLNVFRCDVVMGVAEGSDLMQNTNPYYRSVYALAIRPGSGLDGVTALEDKRLVGKRIGVVAKTPPATIMAMNGLMSTAKPYILALSSQESDAPAKQMMDDLAAGRIDAAVLWGPMAGYFARHEPVSIKLVPLLHEPGPIPMDFSITMGVRYSDQAWKRQLNQLIAKNQDEINRILEEYGVPLVNNQRQLITVSAPG
jgi:mxaJ protein